MTKLPYKIPLMEDINSMPFNGLKVVETFAGGGGSDIGWRWSGYKTIWANEFEKNPCATYRLNHPETFLDTRDIKIISPQEILMRCRLKKGELDVFSGSPPCQGFSIANQNRLQGKEKKYDNGIVQKNEDLFFEYIRLLKGLMPKVFVAENVKGLTIGKAKFILGDFNLDLFDNQDNTILHGLINCGYIVRWQILNAADFGTPQNRLRVFFIGVRKDLGLEPYFPKKLGYQYSVLDALPNLAGDEVSARQCGFNGWQNVDMENPSPALMKSTAQHNPWMVKVRSNHGGKENWNEISKPSPTILKDDAKRGRNANFGGGGWIKIVYGCNTTGKPTKPNLNGNTFLRDEIESPEKPFRTVSKVGGAGGVSCMIQENEERRKFTIEELKRLGGFPDDYQMIGSYSKQWEIIGNSVAPPQMFHIGKCLKENIFEKL